MSTTNIRIAPSLTLHPPEGATLPVTGVGAGITYAGDVPTEYRITFTVSADTWAEIDQRALFGLDPTVRGPTFGGSLDPAADVRIEARLNERLLPTVQSDSADIFEAGALLLTHDEMVQTANWTALFVTQQLGRIRAGFATQASGLLK